MLSRTAGNKRRIDRTDRNASNPGDFDPCFLKRLKDAGLIGAKRAAALQHKSHLLEVEPPNAAMRSK